MENRLREFLTEYYELCEKHKLHFVDDVELGTIIKPTYENTDLENECKVLLDFSMQAIKELDND